MPRNKTYLTPAEYAVLGLLQRRPAYGYELQRHLAGRHGLGLVCPVEPAMVYAILKSLSGLELIDGQWDNSTYPPKAVYTTTDSGEDAFRRWLYKPVARMREVRLDFMVKLFFLLEREEPRAIQLIEDQIEACRAYAKEVEGEMAGVVPRSFDWVALGAKVSAARLNESWLAQCLTSLRPRQGTSRD